MTGTDQFGDRMKRYEMAEAGRHLMPLAPVLARLDGEAFHTFCKGLKKPYDERLSRLMQATARYLLEMTGASIVYTQSDEISLVWHFDDYERPMVFNGRTHKIVGHLAAKASGFFCTHLPEHLPEKVGEIPTFDCRVWNVPNRMEATNTILWREMDATKNSIQSAAQALYPQEDLHGCRRSEQMAMLHAKGVNWDDYPPFFKRGTFFQRRTISRPFSVEEIDSLPPKHSARKNPDLVVERKVTRELEMPPFVRLSNRVEVIFEGAEPMLAQEEA